MNPSSLTGRVVDEDRKPVADFRVFLQPADSPLIMGRGTPAVTDTEGKFTADKLPPGPYIVRVAAEGVQGLSLIDYSEAEAKIVDEAYETAYWPGGVTDAKAALPFPVPPGTPANIGTIILRKARYHRAAVELAGDCTTEEWTYSLIKLPRDPRILEQRSVTQACRKQFIVRNLSPGSYTLAVTVGQKETLRWALSPITITNQNVRARLALSPATDLNIRFVTEDRSPPPNVPLFIQLRVEDAPDFGSTIEPAGEGQRLARSLPWSRYSVTVSRLPPTHYVKEFSYNRLPAPGGRITLVPGGLLEIVLGDRPATISGTVKGATQAVVILRRWPDTHPLLEGNEPFSYMAPLEPGGTFEFRGLAPGEYRIRAARPPLLEDSPAEGEKIVIGEGESKTIELKLP